MSIAVHTATQLDRHTDSLFQHITFITNASLHTVIDTASRWARQVITGRCAGRDTSAVVTIGGTRGG